MKGKTTANSVLISRNDNIRRLIAIVNGRIAEANLDLLYSHLRNFIDATDSVKTTNLSRVGLGYEGSYAIKMPYVSGTLTPNIEEIAPTTYEGDMLESSEIIQLIEQIRSHTEESEICIGTIMLEYDKSLYQIGVYPNGDLFCTMTTEEGRVIDQLEPGCSINEIMEYIRSNEDATSRAEKKFPRPWRFDPNTKCIIASNENVVAELPDSERTGRPIDARIAEALAELIIEGDHIIH